ncbi:MAG: hypothetical protein ACRDQU_00875 [Pseudonocardiaceae bacterium]
MTAPAPVNFSTIPPPTGYSVLRNRLKVVTFVLNGVSYGFQINSWTLTNNTVDGVKTFTYGGAPSEFRTETDDDWQLSLKMFSDWRAGGVSDYLMQNTRAVVGFQLDHHPDIVGQHVTWAGNCVLKAPTVGGDVRMTEETSVNLLILGIPTYTPPR